MRIARLNHYAKMMGLLVLGLNLLRAQVSVQLIIAKFNAKKCPQLSRANPRIRVRGGNQTT